MPKSSKLIIKEDLSELSSLLRKQENPENVIRIQSLIYIKSLRFEKRTELASYLGYNVRSIELWLKDYSDKGIEGMLIPVKEKQQRTRKVSAEIHEGLSKLLNTATEGFLSYVAAQQWVEQTYGVTIHYNTFRSYMIDFFGTKIKSPRKSHIKKSPEAKVDFLKLTESLKTNEIKSK